ncbi:ankyrin repeat domain-containing protein [archaeon]|nr:MAG: ankyrin repeat domain-containing protein [archaeon]
MQANADRLQEAICEGVSYARICGILHEIERNLLESTISVADVINHVTSDANDDRHNSLLLAVSLGNVAVARLLIQNGGDVEMMSEPGQGPLAAAVYYGNMEMIKWMVEEASANPNAIASAGTKMLSAASYTGRLEVVKYLIEDAKMSRHLLTAQGMSALYLACQGENLSLLKYLVESVGLTPSEDLSLDSTHPSLLEESDWDDDVINYLQIHM